MTEHDKQQKKKSCIISKVAETYISSITGVIAFHEEFLYFLNQAAQKEYEHLTTQMHTPHTSIQMMGKSTRWTPIK